MNTQPQEFTLADGEQIVRTYECTMLRKLFSPPTFGHLTVTTKRVVYHSTGKSSTESSRLISEMPVEDVAGINSLVGTSINWFSFIIFAAIIYFGSQLLIDILPRFLSSWYMNILFMIPFGIFWLFEKGIISQQIRDQMAEGLKQSPAGSVINKKDGAFYRNVFRILFFIGIVLLTWNVGFTTEIGWQLRPITYLILIAVYYWIFMLFFGRKKTFSLTVSSRTAKGSGIYIPGDAFNLILNRNNSALGSLNAGPAKDAEIVSKELGAMLMDIQQLGDFGIHKWTA